MTTRRTPILTFAVVGHPNKGKSSLVSTLAQNDRIKLGQLPGTTKSCQVFQLSVGARVILELIDTPGFQRPSKLLALLQSHDEGPQTRPHTLRRLLSENIFVENFPDESQILSACVEADGLIYVVDASSPYGSEYDAELELLRWVGKPRAAIINPISSQEFIEDWRLVLGQYFNQVKTFNVYNESLLKHLELMSSLAEMDETWGSSLKEAVGALEQDFKVKLNRAAEVLSSFLVSFLSFSRRSELATDSRDDESKLESLKLEVLEKLSALEQKTLKQLESLFHFEAIPNEIIGDAYSVLNDKLFSSNSLKFFGLSFSKLSTFATVTGVTAGTGLGIALGGLPILAGSVLGAVFGYGSSVLGFEKLANTKVLSFQLGTKELQVGPVKDPAFAFVPLNRALFHLSQLLGRTHAKRGTLKLEEDKVKSFSSSLFEKHEVKKALKIFSEITKISHHDSPDFSQQELRLTKLISQKIQEITKP